MRFRSRRPVVAAAIAALVLGAVTLGVAGAAAGSSATATYLVLYKKQALPSGAAASIQKAGGTLVYGYGQIGVAVASSDSSAFASTLALDSSVDGVASTAGLGTQVDGGVAADDTADAPVSPGVPAPGNDSLSGLQWDMVQIHAPEARAINGGSPAVVVGDIDTGLDFTHPDLAPNVDFADSVSCIGGVPEHQSGRVDGRQRARHPHRRHDRCGKERDRDRRCRTEREDRRDQGRQRRGVLLPRGGGVRLHVGRQPITSR